MRNKFNQKTDPNKPTDYKIRIKGHLRPEWSDWFEGLTITLEEDGNTLLTGPVIDQAALHGLLKKVRDLGMPLVSVNRVQSNEIHSYRSKKEKKTMVINASLQAPEKSTFTGNSLNKEGETNMNSPKRLARIAGVLYLIVAIFAGFAGSVFTKLYVASDAATTAANVIANAGLVRMAVVSDLIQVAAWVFLALALYGLLKHVHPSVAHAMVILVAVGAGIVCLNDVFVFEGLQVATDSSYAAALGAEGSNALVLMLLDTQHYGLSIASVFYGLWLVPLGYLAYKSGMFPKALGVALITVCVCYLVNVLTAFLAPALRTLTYDYVSIPIWVFELWMVMYLLLIGVRTVKPGVRAPATV
jgi:hypothetical protein